MGFLVHPQLGLLCGAALPFFCFIAKTALLRKTINSNDFSIVFYEHGPNLLLTRGTTIKTGILPLIEFLWVP